MNGHRVLKLVTCEICNSALGSKVCHSCAMKRITELKAQVNRECKWQKQAIGAQWEYDSWATSCGEDYAIMEEWDETPPPYCNHCGGKAVDVTPKKMEQDDED